MPTARRLREAPTPESSGRLRAVEHDDGVEPHASGDRDAEVHQPSEWEQTVCARAPIHVFEFVIFFFIALQSRDEWSRNL